MSSWFASATASLGIDTEKLSTTINKLSEQTKETVTKLSLNTPEMQAERDSYEKEAALKEKYAAMNFIKMPWDTSDEEKVLFVQECHELILKLSEDKQTFLKPFNNISSNSTSSNNNIEASFSHVPEDFSLEPYVSVIRSLLDQDPQLVKMHAELSMQEIAEVNFWKNYFHHCCLIRERLEMNVCEIWYDPNKSQKPSSLEVTVVEEEIVIFDKKVNSNNDNDNNNNNNNNNNEEKEEDMMNDDDIDIDDLINIDDENNNDDNYSSTHSPTSNSSEFELLVSSSLNYNDDSTGTDNCTTTTMPKNMMTTDNNNRNNLEGDDDEVDVDALAAEIARELET